MDKSTLRNRLSLYLLRGLCFCLALLPNLLLEKLVWTLSLFVRFFARKENRKAYGNIKNIYRLPAHSDFARQFLRQVYFHQLITLAENLILTVGWRKQHKIDILGWERFSNLYVELKKKGQGLIVTTAHLGNWEFVARSGAKADGETFVALAKPSKNQAVTQFLEKARSGLDIKVLWTDRKDILRSMLATLKEGSTLGFVMDQKPEGRKGPVVDFFERPTEFVSGPAKLALKTKAPILAVYCIRRGLWRYQIYCEAINYSDDDDENSLTGKLAKSIEEMIRLYPEQWVWNYKRWKF